MKKLSSFVHFSFVCKYFAMTSLIWNPQERQKRNFLHVPSLAAAVNLNFRAGLTIPGTKLYGQDRTLCFIKAKFTFTNGADLHAMVNSHLRLNFQMYTQAILLKNWKLLYFFFSSLILKYKIAFLSNFLFHFL